MKPKVPPRFWIALLYLASALMIVRSLLDADTPGLVYDWGYRLLSGTGPHSLWSIWNPANGGQVDLYRTTFYFDLINLGAIRAGISNIVFFKFAIVALYALVGCGMHAYLRTLRLGRGAALLGGLFYQTSALLLIRLTAGYFGFLVSAAFFPLLLAAYHRSGSDPARTRAWALAGIGASLLAFSQIHFIAFFIMYVAAERIVSAGSAAWWRPVRSAIGIGAGYGALNLFWLAGSALMAKTVATGSAFTQQSFSSRIDSLPHVFWNTLLLSDHGITEDVLVAVNGTPSRKALLFILLAATFWFAYRNAARRKLFIFSALLILAVLPLSLGTGDPFSAFYLRIYDHVPLAKFFRETYHMEYCMLLAYSILVACATEPLFAAWSAMRPPRRALGLGTAVAGIILFNLPTLTGLFGYWQGVRIPQGTSQANADLSRLTAGRIFYPPGLGYWSLKDTDRPGANYPDQLANSFDRMPVTQSSSDLDSKTPIWKLRDAASDAFMRKDPQFTAYLPFLNSDTVVNRESFLKNSYTEAVPLNMGNAAEIRDWAGESIADKAAAFPALSKAMDENGYVAYTSHTTASELYLATGISEICEFSDIRPQTSSFVYSSDPSLRPFTQDACRSPQERALKDASYALDITTLAGLKHAPDRGWSPGYLSFYEGQAFSSSYADFVYSRLPDSTSGHMRVPAQKEGLALTLKYYASPRGGSLTVNGFSVDTKAETTGWRYAALASDTVSSDGTVTLASVSGENAVGALAYVPAAPGSHPAATELLSATAGMSYASDSETRYHGSIDNLSDRPTLLVFQQNYDANWELRIGGSVIKPVMINTYANGFLIPAGATGAFTLSYRTQATYLLLITLSGIGLAALAIGSVIAFRRKDSPVDPDRPRAQPPS